MRGTRAGVVTIVFIVAYAGGGLPVAAQPDTALQAPAAGGASPTPRVEFSAGVGGLASPPYGAYGAALLDARVAVALTRSWSLEAAFDTDLSGLGSGWLASFYQVGGRWMVLDRPRPGSLRAYLSMGGAGWLVHSHLRATQYISYDGSTVQVPARTRTEGIAPYYPYVGVGFTKPFGRGVALSGQVAGVLMVFDDGVQLVLMPSIGLSFGVGRL